MKILAKSLHPCHEWIPYKETAGILVDYIVTFSLTFQVMLSRSQRLQSPQISTSGTDPQLINNNNNNLYLKRVTQSTGKDLP